MDSIITLTALIFIIYAIVIARRNKTPLALYLKITWKKYSGQDIIAGLVIGLIAMAGIFCVELGLGLINVQSIFHIDITFITSFLTLALMAFVEELLFRSFMLTGFIRLIRNQYIAVIIVAALFGLAHSGNPNATAISVISNGLGGVMYSIAFIASDSIWLPFGLHFAWNFFQGPILGFPVSGTNFGGIIQQNFAPDKDIFTGGNYGPEGGFIGISFRIVVIVLLLLYYYYRIKKRSNQAHTHYTQPLNPQEERINRF